MSLQPGGNTLAKQVQLVSARSKRLFQPPEWKRVLRLAAWQAGMGFIDTWLPQRWNPIYAVRLGYSGKGGRDKIPYFERSSWIRNAQQAAPRVTVNGERLRLKIPVPAGHALTPRTAKDFVRLSDVERGWVANAFAAAVGEIIQRGTSQRRTVGSVMVTGKGGKERRVKITGWTRRISDQDRAMTKMISRGGFRAGHVALELNQRAGILRRTRWQQAKAPLTPGQLTKLHQGWRRQAGGSAGPTASQERSGRVRSQTYTGSRLERHAQAQARYRAKYRSLRSATAGADAFISQSI